MALTLVTNSSHSFLNKIIIYTTLLSLLKSVGIVFSLFISTLSASTFKVAKSDFAVNLDVSKPVAFFRPTFVVQMWFNFYTSTRSLMGSRKILTRVIYYIYAMPFLLIQLLNELS